MFDSWHLMCQSDSPIPVLVLSLSLSIYVKFTEGLEDLDIMVMIKAYCDLLPILLQCLMMLSLLGAMQ